MKDGELYTKSKSYEDFIRRAHKCLRQTRLGADVSFMHNLMRMEAGQTPVRGLTHEKQMGILKTHMARALEKLLKWKLIAEDRAVIEAQLAALDRARGSRDLMAIVSASMEATRRFIS
jgi:hypothetical protein